MAQNCKLGVCAHELGHLLFQWQDFYDPNYDEDGLFWKGSGDWDLMASGCYNFGSTVPAHPAGLHKMQHGWVATTNVSQSTQGVRVPPTTANGGRVCKIKSPTFTRTSSCWRAASTQASTVPTGEARCGRRVDLHGDVRACYAGHATVQADGEQQSSRTPLQATTVTRSRRNVGSNRRPPGQRSTSFPGQRSGVRLSNIRFDADGVATFDVTITKAAPAVTRFAAEESFEAATAAAAAKRRKRGGRPKPPVSSASEDSPAPPPSEPYRGEK